MARQFTYLLEVESNEHMLYAKEIGELYGLSSQKIAALISSYAEKANIEVPRLYFNTRNGIKRVYPKDIWRPAMAGFEIIVNPIERLMDS